MVRILFIVYISDVVVHVISGCCSNTVVGLGTLKKVSSVMMKCVEMGT